PRVPAVRPRRRAGRHPEPHRRGVPCQFPGPPTRPEYAMPRDASLPPASTATRRHDLDWVRVCAFGLLVLYHVGMYYVSWDWHVKSPHAGPLLEPAMLLAGPWRLSLLFLVSGVATAFLLAQAQRQAAAGDGRVRFLGNRSWRLLLPLLFGMAVVVPPQSYYEVVEQLPGGYHDGFLAFWLSGRATCARTVRSAMPVAA